LTKDYQSITGTVNTSTTPYVGYAYSEMAGGANHSRLTRVAYPTATGASGKTIAYERGKGVGSLFKKTPDPFSGSGQQGTRKLR
jgi:hypothetical protein